MAKINIGGAVLNLVPIADKPRLKIGNEYAHLTVDTSLAPDKPRLKINIDGANYYPQQYEWVTYPNKYYGPSDFGDSGQELTILDAGSLSVREVNFHVYINYWDYDRHDARVEAWLYWDGGETLLMWYDNQDEGEESVNKDLSHVFSSPVNNLKVVLKVWGGDPSGTNSNSDDLIYDLDVTNINVFQRLG